MVLMDPGNRFVLVVMEEGYKAVFYHLHKLVGLEIDILDLILM